MKVLTWCLLLRVCLPTWQCGVPREAPQAGRPHRNHHTKITPSVSKEKYENSRPLSCRENIPERKRWWLVCSQPRDGSLVTPSAEIKCSRDERRTDCGNGTQRSHAGCVIVQRCLVRSGSDGAAELGSDCLGEIVDLGCGRIDGLESFGEWSGLGVDAVGSAAHDDPETARAPGG